MILAILERNDVAICRFPKDLQDFARKDPIVSVQYSRPRFDNNSRHRRNSTLKVQCPTLNAEIHWTLGIRHWTFGVEMQTATQSSIDLPGIKKLRSGKVR